MCQRKGEALRARPEAIVGCLWVHAGFYPFTRGRGLGNGLPFPSSERSVLSDTPLDEGTVTRCRRGHALRVPTEAERRRMWERTRGSSWADLRDPIYLRAV